MKIKKLLSITLAMAVLLTGLAGCGGNGNTGGSAGGGTSAAQPAGSGGGSSAPDASTPEPSGDGSVPQPEGYPSKTINWIVPVAAGATVDIPCRGLVDVLDLGTSVVIENIAGASQTVGTTEAAQRAADGYTLLTMANAGAIIQPIINEVAFDVNDFRNIVMVAPTVPTVLAVRADSPIKTLDDWFKLLDSGEKYAYGIPSAGGIGHLALVTTLKALGHENDPNATSAVYNGGAENLTALLSGEVDFTIPDAPDALPRVESGEVRVLAVMSDEPCDLFPDAPLMGDHGVDGLGGFVGMKWIAVRADTPDEIVSWLKQELNKAVQSEEYQKFLTDQGYGPVREYTEEEIDEILTAARADYKEVLTDLGMAK